MSEYRTDPLDYFPYVIGGIVVFLMAVIIALKTELDLTVIVSCLFGLLTIAWMILIAVLLAKILSRLDSKQEHIRNTVHSSTEPRKIIYDPPVESKPRQIFSDVK